MGVLINFVFLTTFFFITYGYDLPLSPVSRNVLCYFNINKNCSDTYMFKKDKENFFLNNNNNTDLDFKSKDRWTYVDFHISETKKYYVIPFSLPYENMNKIFIFFPDKNYNFNKELSFEILNSTNVCYELFEKSHSKFSCIFNKEDIEDLLNKKISLYAVIDFNNNKSASIVFDVKMSKYNNTPLEYIEYIDRYKLPNNFNYYEYMNKIEQHIKENTNVESNQDTSNKTDCSFDLDLETCYKEKYLVDPCNKSNFYFCYKKNNQIFKFKLSCYKNLTYNNVFKFCEQESFF